MTLEGFLNAVPAAIERSLDASDLTTYGRDWTKVFPPRPSAILFPRSAEEVRAILLAANATGTAIVPSGGRTGLAGGAVATNGEAVVSLDRMNKLGDVDTRALTVHVGAGAITEAVHEHALAAGLFWPVDFASKGSSQVGGNIATNAGGVRVIRYGLTRNWVLGLEVVTASGEQLVINGALEKNNTGIDLRQLFIGSEGTLGIITSATLKLAKAPDDPEVALVALADLDAVLAFFDAARRGPFTINAFEFFTEACTKRLEKHRGRSLPLSTRATHYVLIEAEAASPEAFSDWLGAQVETGLLVDGTVATSPANAATLWSFREGISESLSATGFPHKNDIALPISELAAFSHAFETLIRTRYSDLELCIFGHIGDGNLHVNVMKDEASTKEAFLARVHEVDAELFALVQAHRGSVSAEHGIGLLKKEWLHYSRSVEEISLMRRMKAVFDPNGILNPGKVF